MRSLLSIIILTTSVSCISDNDIFQKSNVNDVIDEHEIAEIIIEIDSLTLTPEYYKRINTYHDDYNSLIDRL